MDAYRGGGETSGKEKAVILGKSNELEPELVVAADVVVVGGGVVVAAAAGVDIAAAAVEKQLPAVGRLSMLG